MKASFLQLQYSGFEFSHDYEMYQHWLVVGSANRGNLYRHTNLHAMETELRRYHIDTSIVCKTDDNGYDVLLIDPDDEELLRNAAMLDRMSEFRHLDERLYGTALEEAIDECWGNLDIPERIDCYGNTEIDGALWGCVCPDPLRPQFAERVADGGVP